MKKELTELYFIVYFTYDILTTLMSKETDTMLNYISRNRLAEMAYVFDADHGMFSRPETRCNPMSYPIPTCSALEQITKNIYWHPEIEVRVNKAKILSEIKFESFMFNDRDENERNPNKRIKQTTKTYLVKPMYLVSFYLFWNEDFVDISKRGTPRKHIDIFTRRIEKGVTGRPVCMGTTECGGNVSELTKPWEQYDSPINGIVDYGMQYYGVDYKTKIKYMAHMKSIDGVIDYCDNIKLIRMN